MSQVAGAVAVRESARLPLTITVVFAAGLPGLLLLAAVEPVASHLDVAPGLVEYCGVALLWNLATLGVLFVLLPRMTGETFGELVHRWWRLRNPEEHVRHRLMVWLGAAVAGGIGVSSARLWLIDRGWEIAQGPLWSINSPAANRGTAGFSIGVAVVAFQILVRIPLTVFVEETLFRAWVQERHGPILAGALFAGYHLQQWWTIPALVPFGIALSLMRVGVRSIWPGATLHAAGDIVYALQLASH